MQAKINNYYNACDIMPDLHVQYCQYFIYKPHSFNYNRYRHQMDWLWELILCCIYTDRILKVHSYNNNFTQYMSSMSWYTAQWNNVIFLDMSGY